MIWGISLDWPNKKNYFISWAWDLLSAFRLWSSEDLSLVPVLTGFPGGSVVKNLLANAGYRSLGWEDPLEKEMATRSVFLAGKSHGQRSPVGYSPWGCKRVRHNLETKKNKSPSSSFKPLGLKVPDSAAGFLCKVYPSKDMKLLIPRSISNHICILA